MKILNARIDDELMAQLERLSSLESSNKSALVRQALIAYIKKSNAEYSTIPEEIISRIEFLYQIAQYGEFNLTNWKLIGEELKALCSIVKNRLPE
ncbi:MAG: ribbon-helix-helix protein, CopG family [Selenomonadaceae bacterium]|nr:ribbon-helix-helix protein, CopG family [Selenomonadaceae bacterium]